MTDEKEATIMALIEQGLFYLAKMNELLAATEARLGK